MEADNATGNGQCRKADSFPSAHLVSNLSGQATAGDRLAIIQMPQAESQPLSAMAGAGTFFAGQVPHSDTAIAALADHRKVLVVRELRSTLVSCLLNDRPSATGEAAPAWQPATCQSGERRSQMHSFLRQQGPSLFGQFLSILTWMAERDVVILRVEDLLRRDRAALDQLTQLLHLDTQSDINLDRLSTIDALAGSFQAVRLADFWSNETEQLFSAFGGCLWNRALGYDQPYDTSAPLNASDDTTV